MSDEKREALEAQSKSESTNDATVSEELSDEELNNISGGDGKKPAPPPKPHEYLVFTLENTTISNY